LNKARSKWDGMQPARAVAFKFLPLFPPLLYNQIQSKCYPVQVQSKWEKGKDVMTGKLLELLYSIHFLGWLDCVVKRFCLDKKIGLLCLCLSCLGHIISFKPMSSQLLKKIPEENPTEAMLNVQ
jgi:hypothetical protein